MEDYREVDNLVIGAGISGLMLALKIARKERVLILTKGALAASNSWLAQGGVAAVCAYPDSPSAHIEDTIVAGAGLCHEDVVETIVTAGPGVITELSELGVKFSQDQEHLHLFREGGHRYHRIAHADDMTGKEIVKVLYDRVLAQRNIKVYEQQMVIDLITTDRIAPHFAQNVCLGAYVFDRHSKNIYTVRSKRTWLCSGGHGKLYLYTSNSDVATGDGVAMAKRAGCRIANLEFMQFHPTLLFHPKVKNFLITEAIRGEGGVLRRSNDGQEFMAAYHPLESLAPRDTVARAIDQELKKTGADHVYLDVSVLDSVTLRNRFPHVYHTCQKNGIDMDKRHIPVVPGAHYSCGGIVTDLNGHTTVRNLFALGENACTGFHGANRLASNSLLEALVMAGRASDFVLKQERQDSLPTPRIPPWQEGKAVPPTDEMVVLSHTWDEIRRLMWHYVGIVRSEKRLKRAMDRMAVIRRELDRYYWDYQMTAGLIEVRNLALTGWMTIQCAISRKESRGIHYNLDYPDADSEGKDTILH